jgi:hypothetical protein
MVDTPITTRFLDSDHVLERLHHTNLRPFTARVTTYRAFFAITQVMANTADLRQFLEITQRVGKSIQIALGYAE